MIALTHTHLPAITSRRATLSLCTRPQERVLTLPIMTLAAFQERSLGILLPGARSTITAAVTLTQAEGGLPKDFSSVRLACSEEGHLKVFHHCVHEPMPYNRWYDFVIVEYVCQEIPMFHMQFYFLTADPGSSRVCERSCEVFYVFTFNCTNSCILTKNRQRKMLALDYIVHNKCFEQDATYSGLSKP